MKYDYSYQPGTSYEHVVTLLDRNARRGLVIDLGCGGAQIAEPLLSLGFGYVGADFDADALASLAERGIEHHTIDLRRLDTLAESITAAASGREIVAVTMLDVLEHLVDPRAALTALGAAMRGVGAELLALSVPNVAHSDLVAQLLMGRWEVTDAGLLDRTHVSLFTDQRLTAELAACGFCTLERLDIIAPQTEQHVPPDAPAVALSTPLGSALRAWRACPDAFGDTYQFVGVHRLAAIDDATTAAAPSTQPAERPFATVVVRTQGRRSSLEDALTSLAAQTDDSFEVLLIVNTSDPDAVARVGEMLAWFAPAFRDRVELVVLEPATRSAPLNLAIDRARGRYLTFLDDDDVVLAHWIETFKIGLEFPGRIIRSVCYGQDFVHEPGTSTLHYEPIATPVSFAASFDYVEHLVVSKTPFCSIAVPVDALRAAGIRFDEGLDVIEDFDLLIRAAQLCGVIDTGVATSLYRRWKRDPGTPAEITHERWAASLDAVLAKLDATPLLLPAHSATRLRMLEYNFHRLGGEIPPLRKYIFELESQVAGLQHQVDAYERSRFWKLTKPLRVAAQGLHGVRSRLRGH